MVTKILLDHSKRLLKRETEPDSLPVLTIPNLMRLAQADYRQLATHKLAEVVLYLENYLGVGRIYIP